MSSSCGPNLSCVLCGVISIVRCSRAALAVGCACEFPEASAQVQSVAGPACGVIINFDEITPQDRGVIKSENNSLAHGNGKWVRRTCRGAYVFPGFRRVGPCTYISWYCTPCQCRGNRCACRGKEWRLIPLSGTTSPYGRCPPWKLKLVDSRRKKLPHGGRSCCSMVATTNSLNWTKLAFWT